MGKTIPVEIRFWERVNKTESCWLWTGSVGHFGYGRFWYKGDTRDAHRVSWMIHKGEIPNGMQVLHNCPNGDNPRCVNPEHLWLGTIRENQLDKVKKGRQAKGEKMGAAKLTNDKVLQIREIRLQGITIVKLGQMFSVHHSVISDICTRKTWKHI